MFPEDADQKEKEAAAVHREQEDGGGVLYANAVKDGKLPAVLGQATRHDRTGGK